AVEQLGLLAAELLLGRRGPAQAFPASLGLGDRALQAGGGLLQDDLELRQLGVDIVLGLEAHLPGELVGLGQDALGLLARGPDHFLLGHQAVTLGAAALNHGLGVPAGLVQQFLAILDNPAGLLDLLGEFAAGGLDR